MDCVTFHLLLVFWSVAAKTQQFYISNGLKKPNRVPISQFMQRIQQLNGYLDLLLCLFYSKNATKLTKVVQAFDDVDLAITSSKWSLGTGKTSTNLRVVLCRRVFVNCLKRLSTSKRPS